MKKIETTFTLGIGLLIIFISSNLSLFVWESIVGYYLLIILASFFCGLINVEFDSSLKLLAVTFIASTILFVILYISPSMFLGEAYYGEIDYIVSVVAPELARAVIISFPISVFTCLAGSFSGKNLTRT